MLIKMPLVPRLALRRALRSLVLPHLDKSIPDRRGRIRDATSRSGFLGKHLSALKCRVDFPILPL